MAFDGTQALMRVRGELEVPTQRERRDGRGTPGVPRRALGAGTRARAAESAAPAARA